MFPFFLKKISGLDLNECGKTRNFYLYLKRICRNKISLKITFTGILYHCKQKKKEEDIILVT